MEKKTEELNARIKFRLTPEEEALLKREARRAGLTVSAFVRSLLKKTDSVDWFKDEARKAGLSAPDFVKKSPEEAKRGKKKGATTRGDG